MRIRKSKFVITALLASFGLSVMGATFAKWAVTDNANSFSVFVTIGDVPVVQGYYLTFAEDNYSAKASSAVLLSSDTDNKAYANNLTINDGESVRIDYYDGATFDGYGTTVACSLGEPHGYVSINQSTSVMTFDIDRGGNIFSLYLNNSDQIYMVDETYSSFDGYYITYLDDDYAFVATNKLTSHDTGDNVADINVSIAANKSFKIEHFAGARGIIQSPNKQGANYTHFTTSEYLDDVITTKEAGNYHLMVSRGNSYTYIANNSLSGDSGYYIVYSSSNYDYRYGFKMSAGGSGNLAEANLEVASGTTIKIVYVDAVNDSTSGNYTQGMTADYLSTSVGSSTLTFTATHTYDFYLNGEGKIYTDIGEYVTIYLNTGGSSLWNQGGAFFYAWVWESGKGGRYVSMSAVSGRNNYFEMTIHSYEGNVIFLRCHNVPVNPEDMNNNDYVWNKTNDLTYGSNNCYTITGWGGGDGNWSTIS